MLRSARTLLICSLSLMAFARFRCDFKLPFSFGGTQEKTPAEQLPVSERLMRAADLILMEPGYAQARELSAKWKTYISAFLTDERRAAELEALANEPAIVAYLKDSDGPLAPVFEKEARRLIDSYGRQVFKAWRLRTLAGKVILAESPKRLADLDTSVVRREIGPRFITIPISGTGFNFSLDAEWDITRLPDFPLSQINSEYFFLQVDNGMNLAAVAAPGSIPDAAFRFISGGKFIAQPHGVQNGMRVVISSATDFHLIICYPFAGIYFYLVRGVVAVLLIIAFIILAIKLASLRKAAEHVIENRPGKWLEGHYQQSLGMHEKALGLTDKSIAAISDIKERDAQIFRELGTHLQELSYNFTQQTERMLRMQASATAANTTAQHAAPAREPVTRPMHKKAVHKAPIIIPADLKPEIEVAIELDLPLSDEKKLTSADKATFISSLKRRAQAKSAGKEFIHDEKIDNYDFVPEPPLPIPEITPPASGKVDDKADLEYVQKFRYQSKTRVLPMTAAPEKPQTLQMREDLKNEILTIHDDE